MPDERLGEVGMAFVVPRPGETATPDELIAWVAAEMANYKVPRHVEFVDELPLEREREGAEVRAAGAGEQRALSAAVTPAA